MNIHSRMHDSERYTLHCTHATLIRMCGGWYKAGVSGFVISISTYFFGSPKPPNRNVQTSVHVDRLKSSSLLHWNGGIPIADFMWSNTRTVLGYVNWNRWFEFCRSRKIPVERYASWIGVEERQADSALALYRNKCYGYLTFRWKRLKCRW